MHRTSKYAQAPAPAVFINAINLLNPESDLETKSRNVAKPTEPLDGKPMIK